MRAVPVAVSRSAVLATCSPTLLAFALVACGTSSKTTTTPTTPAPPPQPSYPSTPPVPITWSPSTSLLPAPPACDPPSSTCTPPDFKGETPPMWDIWDDASGVWRETNVPCNPFPANTRVHLIWTLERAGNQVHYISLQVGTQVYNVDTYYDNQTGWTLEEIDVAFQTDMAEPAVPYNVWLDEVNLTAY